MADTDKTLITEENAAEAFAKAAQATYPMPEFSGKGIIIAAGGPYLPSAYVVVRVLRHLGAKLPIEIWHAGKEEKPVWAEEAFESWNATFRDVMDFCPDRPLKQMRGWPIKPAALLHTSFRYVLFIDADCFPVRNPEFLFDTPEFQEYKAVFWPDNKSILLGESGKIWKVTDLQYRGDQEFETGLILLDKQSCWQELCLTEWMNANSDFWYNYAMGDKDTFYVSWRKLNRSYFIAPPCQRVPLIMNRHYWTDGNPLAEHRAGGSKYAVPYKEGPFRFYTAPYKWRNKTRNLLDELIQRFLVSNFSFHTNCLMELKKVHDKYLPTH